MKKAAVIAVAVLALAGCHGSKPTPAKSPSVSPTPVVTPDGSATPSDATITRASDSDPDRVGQCWVRPHTRKDGARVHGYWRAC
jgi:hypothetical protein